MKKFGSFLIAFLMLVLSVSGLSACRGKKPDLSGVVYVGAETEYDGEEHFLSVENLPENVTVQYDGNGKSQAGEYDVTVQFYRGEELLKTETVVLRIAKRAAKVYVDDQSTLLNEPQAELTYRTEGVLANDDLGLELSVDQKEGANQITAAYTNPNYDVEFIGGNYVFTQMLFDGSNAESGDNGYSAYYAPVAPFMLYDTSYFSGKVITEIAFPFVSLAGGVTVSSKNLFMPVYVVKKDFSTQQSDCTLANGKKFNLDFTGKLQDVKNGDWIKAENLHIPVGEDETLAFGDSAMKVLPGFSDCDAAHPFYSEIFTNKNTNGYYSLVFKIKGYSQSTADRPDDGKEEGKTYLSILGDSISTYDGISNSITYNSTLGPNAVWFPNDRFGEDANFSVNKTWWKMTADLLKYEICVNNSFSGAAVHDAYTYNTRAKNLHDNKKNISPDVVVIFMGVNDYAYNKEVGTFDGKGKAPTLPRNFSEAYAKTVQTVQANYPDADIYCCTFLPDRNRFTAQVNENGVSPDAFNAAIRTICANTDCYLIDLAQNTGTTWDNILERSVDGLHPNAQGMKIICNTVKKAIAANVETAQSAT